MTQSEDTPLQQVMEIESPQTPQRLATATSASCTPVHTPTPCPVAEECKAHAQLQCPLLCSPAEIIHRILCDAAYDDPPTLANVARTCRAFRTFIYDTPGQALWRDLHLRRYDDPRQAGAFDTPRSRYDWQRRFQERAFVARVFREWTEDQWDELIKYVGVICETLMDLYLDLPAQSGVHDETVGGFFGPPSTRNGPVLEAALRSETFRHMYLTLLTRELSPPQLRPLPGQGLNPHRKARRVVVYPTLSRLHLLLAPELSHEVSGHRQHRGYLRELVYGASNYRPDNDYAPLHPDGTVNWTLVDAISTVMMLNAKDVLALGEESWRPAVQPMSFGIDRVRGTGFANLDLLRPKDLGSDDVWDWAGVGGMWYGSYAFLDYSDWIQLNEPRVLNIHRRMATLDLSRYAEAIGDLMRLDVVVDKDETGAATAFNARAGTTGAPLLLTPLETPLPTSNLLPPIYFHGTSMQQSSGITHPSGSPASFVRGVVRLTSDSPPEVRWTIIIRYGGEDRWRLEGVQVGGRGSKRGFFGVWTDALKEEHSPNGPVWYWKP